MDRRNFLRGTVGALSAAVAASAARNGVDARETATEGVEGQPVAENMLMSLATQGTAHYAMPVDGSRMLVAVMAVTGRGSGYTTIPTVSRDPAYHVEDAPAFLSEPR